MRETIKRTFNRLAALTVATLLKQWMSTLDYAATYYDPQMNPAHPNFQGPALYVLWHENMPALLYTRSFNHIAFLASRHQDAEILSQTGKFFGFEVVRGSTNRGGVSALRDMSRKGAFLNLAITPDGPRGPRRQCAPGAIFIAAKLQIPIVVVGVGYNDPWRFNTWDRFAIPPLWGRARGVVGPPLYLPADLDRDGIEHYRGEVERQLNTFSDLAEQWATHGGRMPGQVVEHRTRAKQKPRALADKDDVGPRLHDRAA